MGLGFEKGDCNKNVQNYALNIWKYRKSLVKG
jgi:hypothetical protein